MIIKSFPVNTRADHGYGFKFLNPRNATNFFLTDYVYPVPGRGEKWGPWFTHPTAASHYDGRACGPNGLHVMRSLDTSHAPSYWYPWFAEYRDILGYDDEKVRVRSLRLRRIAPRVYYRLAALGWLAGIGLVNLPLGDFTLNNPDFHYTHFINGHFDLTTLVRANFRNAKLTRAKFFRAKIDHSNFSWADIEGGYFIATRFYSNNFERIDLIDCLFEQALFDYVKFDEGRITDCRFSNSAFRGCKFQNTVFKNVDFRGVVFDRVHFDGTHFEDVKIDPDTQFNNSIVTRPVISGGCEDLQKLFRINRNLDDLHF